MMRPGALKMKQEKSGAIAGNKVKWKKQIIIETMFKKSIYWTLMLLAFLFSCSSEENVADGGPDIDSNETGITVSVNDMIFADEAETRSSLSFDASRGMLFSWNANDKLTVFAGSSDASTNQYKLTHIVGGTTTVATFDAEGFTLTKGERYYTISTVESNAPTVLMSDEETYFRPSIPDKRNIRLTYAGQRQILNGIDLEKVEGKLIPHLGAYDYMAASAIADGDNHAKFGYKHLGATLRLNLKSVPKGVKYRALEIYDSEDSFRQPVRTIDLTNGLSGDTYNPSWDGLNMISEEYKTSDRFVLFLGPDTNGDGKNSNDEGINPIPANDADENGRIVAYMQIPPFDFRGKEMIFSLKSVDGSNDYYGVKNGINAVAGSAYNLNVDMVPSTNFKVNVKIDYDWQHGDAKTELTRAISDPGLDDDFEKPEYIYAFFCYDSKIKSITEIKVGDNIATNPNDKWSDRNVNNEIEYQTPLTFVAENPEDISTARVYIMASNTAYTHGLVVNGDESSILTKKYDIPSGTQDESQAFLRDLYSTPWEGTEHAATFVGKLEDPYHDVVLYHVAAKVDLKWDSEAKLSGSVSVNNVLGTNLSIFQPTTNTWAAGSYSVSTPITSGMKYIGRKSYYLPQFANDNCKYNVTIGDNVHNGTAGYPYVTFSPSTTGGFTSWLRWVKDY